MPARPGEPGAIIDWRGFYEAQNAYNQLTKAELGDLPEYLDDVIIAMQLEILEGAEAPLKLLVGLGEVEVAGLQCRRNGTQTARLTGETPRSARFVNYAGPGRGHLGEGPYGCAAARRPITETGRPGRAAIISFFKGGEQMREELMRSYYDKRADEEWRRYERHRMEFEITMRVLSAHLPAQGSILDCGGGPGRYAIWLARKGYELTVFDLSEGCLGYARAQATEAGVSLRCERGSATDLGRFEAGEFEAVLLLGPLYHLLEFDQRRRALTEAVRVLRPGGVLAAAFIPRTAPLRFVAKEMADSVGELYRPMLNVIRHGSDESFPPADDEHFHAYFSHPDEVQPLLRDAGLEVTGLFAAEGFVSMIDESVNVLDGEDWEAWVDLTCLLPSQASYQAQSTFSCWRENHRRWQGRFRACLPSSVYPADMLNRVHRGEAWQC